MRWRVQSDAGVVVSVVVALDEVGDEPPRVHQGREPFWEHRSELPGLGKLSLRGLSLLARGLEWELVTSRSDNNVATVLLVMAVPRSAWTTSGMPCSPNTSVINSAASTADSAALTRQPTMYRE